MHNPPHLTIETSQKQISKLVKTLFTLHKQTDWQHFNAARNSLNDILEGLNELSREITNEDAN